MKLFIGADHRGFALKESLKSWLMGLGHTVTDCGNTVYDKDDDYPDFALAVAQAVAAAIPLSPQSPQSSISPQSPTLGLVVCGSGGGVTMAANKVPGIRCAQGFTVDDASHNRDHNDMNVLALSSDILEEKLAREMISVFISTPFSHADRCNRRIQKITQYERSKK